MWQEVDLIFEMPNVDVLQVISKKQLLELHHITKQREEILFLYVCNIFWVLSVLDSYGEIFQRVPEESDWNLIFATWA